MGTYVTAPELTVEVAFSNGPWDASPTWTDISDRVRGFDMTRGRKGSGDAYNPGSIVVLLDNSDRLLDPYYASALNYLTGLKGLPLSPVRVRGVYDGTTSDIFYGYLGPECWVDTPASIGTEATTTMTAFDTHGLLLRRELFPTGTWGIISGYLDPDWWTTGDVDFPALDNGSGVPNMVPPSTASATVSGVTTGNYLWCGPKSSGYPSIEGANTAPTMRFGLGVKLTADNGDIMPDGDEDDTTDMVFWNGEAQASDQSIMTAVSPGGSTKRWDVVCTSAGAIKLTVYNAGGSVLSSVNAPANPADGGGRWDNSDAYHIIVRHEGGVASKLQVAGETATTGTPIVEVLDSDIVLGSGPGVHYFWHHQHWNRYLSDAEISVPTIYIGTALGPWRGDTLTQRIGHWYDAYGVTNNATVHIGTDDGDYSTGMYEVSGVYVNMAGALLDTVYAWGGSMWADKSGGIRARSMTATSNTTHATHYATACANFTDEASPAGTPTPLRRGPVTFTGIDMDTIINEFFVRFQFGGELGSFDNPTTATLSKSNSWSINRFGRKTNEITTTVGEWEWAAYMAGALANRYAVPAKSMNDLELYPWGDDALTTWVLEEAELERAVDVTYTPPSGGSATTVTLNILGIRWSWEGTRWRVTLSLGEL